MRTLRATRSDRTGGFSLSAKRRMPFRRLRRRASILVSAMSLMRSRASRISPSRMTKMSRRRYENFETSRRTDIDLRTPAVDLLNRSLLVAFAAGRFFAGNGAGDRRYAGAASPGHPCGRHHAGACACPRAKSAPRYATLTRGIVASRNSPSIRSVCFRACNSSSLRDSSVSTRSTSASCSSGRTDGAGAGQTRGGAACGRYRFCAIRLREHRACLHAAEILLDLADTHQ